MARPTIRPIDRADVDRVARLLLARFLTQMPLERITRAILHDWPVARPNYGYLMEAEGEVVGCILAAYSERTIRGRTEHFCNLGAWYVDPPYRAFSLVLSTRFRELPNVYTYTALTPNPVSQASFKKFNYRVLSPDFHVYLAGQGGWGTRLLGARILTNADDIEKELDPVDRQILRDHRPYGLSHYLLQVRGSAEYGYVVAQRRRFNALPAGHISEILYVSNKPLVARYFERLKIAMLLHDRSLAIASDRRLLGPDAPVGIARPRPRFYHSHTLDASDIDNLYSEVVLL